MYAVIKTGGKQYKVAPGALLAVAKLSGEAGDSVAFENVILVGGDEGTTVGSPLVAGATVAGEIVGQKRTAKILVFKKRRRQNSKRSRGHRQDLTLIRITEILTDGKKPEVKKAKAAAVPVEARATAEAAAGTEPEAKPAKAKRAAAKPAAEAAGETAAAKPPRSPRKKAATEDSDDADKAKPARKPRAKAAKTDDKD
jgi:large subunit ribosomal protein L21